MKALNTMKFVINATRDFERMIVDMKNEADFEISKKIGCKVLGFIDGMITFTNTMICAENNDFTGDFSAQLSEWTAEVYQIMAAKAIDAKADPEYIARMLRNRDEYMDNAKEEWEEA